MSFAVPRDFKFSTYSWIKRSTLPRFSFGVAPFFSLGVVLDGDRDLEVLRGGVMEVLVLLAIVTNRTTSTKSVNKAAFMTLWHLFFVPAIEQSKYISIHQCRDDICLTSSKQLKYVYLKTRFLEPRKRSAFQK
jgi:hypothetical protein